MVKVHKHLKGCVEGGPEGRNKRSKQDLYHGQNPKKQSTDDTCYYG